MEPAKNDVSKKHLGAKHLDFYNNTFASFGAPSGFMAPMKSKVDSRAHFSIEFQSAGLDETSGKNGFDFRRRNTQLTRNPKVFSARHCG